ncbi:Lrp/AsnC family transcriptional regulator [Natronorarus salvus]|uniref:Lrp/AsnC family transcriptional regulator n=1 Tax=Natronorarus salvus TaxID=3117733 RepID=UPI002F26B9A2
MSGDCVSKVDREILYLLQKNARYTATEIGASIGVSDTTVRNRLRDLEEGSVVRGYRPIVDYERAGFHRPFHLTCTAPITERERIAEEAARIPGVVRVSERTTGRENLLVEVVGEHADDVTEVARRLDALGARIEEEAIVRATYRSPLQHLAPERSTERE